MKKFTVVIRGYYFLTKEIEANDADEAFELSESIEFDIPRQIVGSRGCVAFESEDGFEINEYLDYENVEIFEKE